MSLIEQHLHILVICNEVNNLSIVGGPKTSQVGQDGNHKLGI